MPNSVSIRSLARDLGWSTATISEGLRDSPKVNPATRARIQEAARTAGYQRKPLLSATFSALRLGRRDGFSGTLALVDGSQDGTQTQFALFHREIALGAASRAQELGFTTEAFWIGKAAPGLSVKRLNSVLKARGIPGIIFLPFDQPQNLSGIALEQVAAVSMEHRVIAPHLHTIEPDHYLAMRRAVGSLMERGYRRIGLCLEAHKDARVDHKWSSGFISFFRLSGQELSVPPLIAERLDRGRFRQWFRRHQPDLVIGHNEAIMTWIQELGVRIPEAAGFFRINITERVKPCAGLDLRPRQLGATAVETVVDCIHRHEQGVPLSPKTISIDAAWVDGATLRRRTVARSNG